MPRPLPGLALLAVALLTACDKDAPRELGEEAPEPEVGVVSLALDAAGLPLTLHEVVLSLVRAGEATISRTAIAQGTTVLMLIRGVPVGEWTVIVEGRDWEGATIFCGSAAVGVLPRQITAVDVSLAAADQCAPFEFDCGNGLDDDLNGLSDCADPACDGHVCDDQDLCTTGELCANGACRGTAIDCDDGQVCTIDRCSPLVGCAHAAAPSTTVCDDGSACTKNDRCSGGICQPGTFDCDDRNPCTADLCALGECQHNPISGCCLIDTECADSDSCTADRCVAHACTHAPIPDCCHVRADCDDANPCTRDDCLVGNCAHRPVPACCVGDGECDDGDACTVDQCAANACGHTSLGGCCRADSECEDGDVCTADSCVGNACARAPIAGCCTSVGQCDDGDACTTDSCTGNRCANDRVAGCCTATAQCNDDNPCTLDRCLFGACSNGPVVGHPGCDDHDPCTSGDVCGDSVCAGTASAGPGCAAPEVAIVAPGNGASFTVGSSVTVEVDADDADGIGRVRFYLDDALVAEDDTAPYSQEITLPASAGAHTLAADAVDGTGVASAPVEITVYAIVEPVTTLVGRVVDATLAPIAGADVGLLDSGRFTTSAADGSFGFDEVGATNGLEVAVYAVVGGTARFETFGPFAPVAGGTTDAGALVLDTTGVADVPWASVVSAPVGFVTRPGFGPAGEEVPMSIVSAPVGFATRPGFGVVGEQTPLAVVSAPVGFVTRPGFGVVGEQTPLAVVSAPVGFTTRPVVRETDPQYIYAVGVQVAHLPLEIRGLGLAAATNVSLALLQGSPGLQVDTDTLEVLDEGLIRVELFSDIELFAGTYEVVVSTPLGSSWSEATAQIVVTQ